VALNTLADQCGGFEGNAQTLRILSRLEPKIISDEGESFGLNLTRAALRAASKYPWPKIGSDGVERTKYGAYVEDQHILDWILNGSSAPAGVSVEAQVMDASDDIAYSVHDVEDAIALGRLDPACLTEPREVDELLEATRAWYGNDLSADALGAAFDRLSAQPYWIRFYHGTVADAAHLKNLTSEIIGRFVSAVATSTREAYGSGPLPRYEAELVIPEETAAEILLLKGIAVRYVMEPREHEPVYMRQRTLIFDLADALMTGGGKGIDPVLLDVWNRAESDDERLRVVVDQIASLTDTSARAWHARLCGMFSEV